MRELRLIAEHKPRYNRRSRFPERVHFIKLTVEPWPRLSLVRQVLDDGAEYVGPFSSKRMAERAMAALHDTFPIRQCSGRMPKLPMQSACVLAEMDRCLSPCNQSVTHEDYVAVVDALREAMVSAPDPVVSSITRRMTALAGKERFEEATSFRERLASFLRGTARTQRLKALTRCPEIVAARKEDGRWAVHVIRTGRLAAAGHIPAGADATSWVRSLQGSAETVLPGIGPTPAATAEESERILRWLEADGVRLVHVEGEWSCPVAGASKHLKLHDAVNESRKALVPFDERRDTPTVHQPDRQVVGACSSSLPSSSRATTCQPSSCSAVASGSSSESRAKFAPGLGDELLPAGLEQVGLEVADVPAGRVLVAQPVLDDAQLRVTPGEVATVGELVVEHRGLRQLLELRVERDRQSVARSVRTGWHHERERDRGHEGAAVHNSALEGLGHLKIELGEPVIERHGEQGRRDDRTDRHRAQHLHREGDRE